MMQDLGEMQSDASQRGSCLTTEFQPVSAHIGSVRCPDVHNCSSVFIHGEIVPAGWTEMVLGFLNRLAHVHPLYMHTDKDNDMQTSSYYYFILPRQPVSSRDSHNTSVIKSIMDRTFCLFLHSQIERLSHSALLSVILLI